ncbi:ribosomal RNA small subunit methyltransferase B [Mediterraneibacter butyricigenes]|uniref:16S rRNA (cytosine(967)-C(5))-methyltransferase n=1 Tax=Mediterraneibacter butyricigenes TaxID=2316025 RepID=A0A391P2R2_9FIRM|nr:16S rRNA (cytosine(967)-C(5))-methyltransferase RsmB [Mediterraneibacter butyricigenes]GCA66306.1 ribosomal RNA small subunit methyltransferase B [Mediterraneibacter butyricigenes]
MTKTISEREIAFATLYEITENGVYSHVILGEVLNKYQYLEKRERAFITRVVEGTLEHQIELDYILDQFSKTKTRKMKPVIRCILRMSVYQLKYMDSVPVHAVCNEAVKLAVKKGFSGLKGFVNGVLRNVARSLDQVKYPGKEEPLRYLSVRYSMPEWIVKLWLDAYSFEVVEQILQGLQEKRPLTVRCNPMQGTPEALKKRLEKEGVTVSVHPYLKEALILSDLDHLSALESFRDGAFQVQDVSSMLVGEVADPAKGAKVLDVCAAPGGKSIHIAQLLDGTGSVEARDLTEAKAELIRENVKRCKAENLTVKVADAQCEDPDWKEQADLVIADLPCSGLGVMGRKPDLKYRMTKEDALQLAELQRQMLSVVKNYVAPGGTLMYSTCTIHRAENEENVKWFLKEFPEFELEEIRPYLPEVLRADAQTLSGCDAKDPEDTDAQKSRSENGQLPETKDTAAPPAGMIQLLPGVHACDGFFLAKFRKKKR